MAIDRLTRNKILKEGVLGVALAVIVVISSIVIVNLPNNQERISPDGKLPTDTLQYTIKDSIQTSFGTYVPYEATLDISPSLDPFTISSDLSNVKNYNPSHYLYADLTDEAKNLLVENAFVVIPSNYAQMYDIYIENTENGIPNFVTTDSVLHAYHVLYDNVLRMVEGDHFESMLLNLTELMVEASKLQYKSINAPSVKEAARKNLAFFTVASKLLDSSVVIDSAVLELVEAELDLIEDHQAIQVSPIFGYEEDYSQYVPRGHYTRTEGLSKFFKAMMWYGRISFRLKPPMPVDSPIKLSLQSNGDQIIELQDFGQYALEQGKNETRQAVLIALAMTSSEAALELWHAIYDPTVFFVGSADDLIYSDYWKIINATLDQPVDPEILADDDVIEDIITEGLTYRNPRIISSIVYIGQNASECTKGLRFMGQRFIPDSYIFQQLVHDNVWSRYFPTALDIFAVLGSNRSKELLVNETLYYSDYLPERLELEQEFATYNESSWTQNLYWLWLYSLFPLLTPKGQGYPMYMQTEAWVDKELFASLGSWTELRHDTILYAKQSYTKRDSAPPKSDQGYVEPNPSLYARLSSLTNMTLNGLKNRKILPSIIKQRLISLHMLLLSMTEISKKELEGIPLNNSEIHLIEDIGKTLESIVNVNESVYFNEIDERMAIVADVHTEPNSNQVLEEAVGDAFVIFTLNEVNGEIILSRGATFSYYEFKHPLSDRLTDEAWQAMLDEGSVPHLPSWTTSFIAMDSFIEK